MLFRSVFALTFCLVFLLSVNGVFSFCESLNHLPVGEWICNTTVKFLVLDTSGNCDVDLTGVIAGCELLQATNALNPLAKTLNFSNYVCNEVALCDAMAGLCDPGQVTTDTNVQWTSAACTAYTSLGAGVLPTYCYNADASGSVVMVSLMAMACAAVALLW